MEAVALFERLRWLDDPEPRTAAMNMALDEALLLTLNQEGEPWPLLRTYLWDRPSVSIGCFDLVAEARKLFPNVPLVRRWTGGGIVEHGHDLTYSLLVPRRLIPTSWQGAGAYRAIHLAVAVALRACGLEGVSLADGPVLPGGRPSKECFRRPVDYDVMLHGKKVAGGAQRRTRLGLLHQGSILGDHVSFAPGGILHRSVGAALPGSFARTWEKRPLAEAELPAAARLVATRYGTAEWIGKF